MKKSIVLSVAFVLTLCLSLITLFACGGGGNDDSGEIIYNGGIYKKDGSRANALMLVGVEKGTTSLQIPEKIDGYDVVKIESNAFRGNATLGSLVFSSGLDDGAIIGQSAFKDCTALKSVTLNGRIKIDGSAFHGCTALESFVAPDAVSLGGNIFSYESNSIKELNIGAQAIDKESDDSYLLPCKIEKLTLNGDVNATGYITSETLKSVTINGSTVNITFKSCPLLTDVTVSKEACGFPLLRDCPLVKEIALPKKMTAIATPVLIDCSGLERITIYDLDSFLKINAASPIATLSNLTGEFDMYVDTAVLEDLTVPSSINKIPSHLFAGCRSLKTLTLHNGVSEIGEATFLSCRNLTEVKGSESLVKIGASAFKDASLTSFTLGSGIGEIGSHAFLGNDELYEVYNLSSLNLTRGSTNYGGIAQNAVMIYTSLDTPSSLGAIDGFLFYTENGESYLYGYAGADKQITLPKSYKGEAYSIGDYAFKGEKILSVTIPEGVKSIGNYAFDSSDVLAVYIKDASTTLCADTFYGSKVKELYYQGSLQDLNTSNIEHKYADESEAPIISVDGSFAFMLKGRIPSLILYSGESESITLPLSCNGSPYIITDSAFAGNQALMNITIPENAVLDIERDAFKGLNLNYTETGCAKYLSGWLIEYLITPEYDGIFELQDGTVGIASGAVRVKGYENAASVNGELLSFLLTHKTSEIKLPSSLKSLGSQWCLFLSLQENAAFVLPDSTRYIGTGAIPDGIDSLQLPQNVKYLMEGALDGLTITNESFTVTSDFVIFGLQNASFNSLVIADSVVLPYNLSVTAKKVVIGSGVSIESTVGMTTITSPGIFKECNMESLTAPTLKDYFDFVRYCNANDLYWYNGYNNPIKDLGASLFIGNCEVKGELVVDEGITEIPDYAFCGLDINKVVLSDSIMTVGSGAFDSCDGLTEITFGSNLTECKASLPNITKIHIASIESWLDISFTYLTSSPVEVYLDTVRLETLYIPEGVGEIPNYAFYNWKIKRIVLPDSVTKVGQCALYSESIEEIEGGMNVSEIGYQYKHPSTLLKGYVYGNVRYDWDGAIEPVSTDIVWARLKTGTNYPYHFFEGCSKLAFVYVPKDCTLGTGTFYNVNESFTVMFEDEAPETIGWAKVHNPNGSDYTLGNYYGLVQYGRIKTYVKLSGDFAYEVNGTKATVTAYFGNSTDVTIPSSVNNGLAVTKIGEGAFLNRTDIASVSLGESIETVGANAFSGCSSLTSVNLGHADTLDVGAFAHCSSLKEIMIPASIRVISAMCFSDCTELERVVFASSASWDIIEIVALDQTTVDTVSTDDAELNALRLTEDCLEYFWKMSENRKES